MYVCVCARKRVVGVKYRKEREKKRRERGGKRARREIKIKLLTFSHLLLSMQKYRRKSLGKDQSHSEAQIRRETKGGRVYVSILYTLLNMTLTVNLAIHANSARLFPRSRLEAPS